MKIDLEMLQRLTSLDSDDLTRILDRSGYRDCKFVDSSFIRVVAPLQFVYEVEYSKSYADGIDKGFVYVRVNTKTGEMMAEF